MDSIQMLIRLIWITLFLRLGFAKIPMCMDREVNEEMITLNCTVDDFVSDIDFKFPNKTGEAYCIVPVTQKIQCTCKCNFTLSCECNATQDIPSNTTTLRIWNTDLTGMFGWYTCTHGSFEKSIMVDEPFKRRTDNADDLKNKEMIYIVVCTLSVTVSIGISVLFCLFPDIPGRMKNRYSFYFRRNDDETGSIFFKKSYGCVTCFNIPICGICVTCESCYCDTCCTFHLKDNKRHQVCQIQHASDSQVELKCKICLKFAERICGKCWKLFCAICCTEHREHEQKHMIIIYQAPLAARQVIPGGVPEQLTFISKSKIQVDVDEYAVRICGIGYLEDGTVVAADGNNCKLIGFKPGEDMKLKKNINDEPCAMTAMTGNEIAVTYPNEKHIGIYQITCNTTEQIFTVSKCEGFNTRDFGLPNCKPFSIAYNNGFFAVEVGVGNDGRIVILDNATHSILHRIPCKFANFTGLTIRLGLIANNKQEGQVIVSAIGKKMIFCIDYNGNKKWHISIPSPRSIIVIVDCELNTNIILSSRRCNAIYESTKQSGQNGDKREIFKVKDNINSPRFMAYNDTEKMLCVLVENDVSHDDELAFYKFIDQEPTELTSLVS